jgi:hypothetical protein
MDCGPGFKDSAVVATLRGARATLELAIIESPACIPHVPHRLEEGNDGHHGAGRDPVAQDERWSRSEGPSVQTSSRERVCINWIRMVERIPSVLSVRLA